MANVKITSVFTGDTWQGEVDLPRVPAERASENLELLFRLFNRVDERDTTRLDDIGYTLPSMSVGDRVEVDGVAWRVEPLGFERETDDLGSFWLDVISGEAF
jgi:hypothetical protein